MEEEEAAAAARSGPRDPQPEPPSPPPAPGAQGVAPHLGAAVVSVLPGLAPRGSSGVGRCAVLRARGAIGGPRRVGGGRPVRPRFVLAPQPRGSARRLCPCTPTLRSSRSLCAALWLRAAELPGCPGPALPALAARSGSDAGPPEIRARIARRPAGRETGVPHPTPRCVPVSGRCSRSRVDSESAAWQPDSGCWGGAGTVLPARSTSPRLCTPLSGPSPAPPRPLALCPVGASSSIAGVDAGLDPNRLPEATPCLPRPRQWTRPVGGWGSGRGGWGCASTSGGSQLSRDGPEYV